MKNVTAELAMMEATMGMPETISEKDQNLAFNLDDDLERFGLM